MGLQGQNPPPEEKSVQAGQADVAVVAADLLLGVRRAVTDLQSIGDRTALLQRAPAVLCANTLFDRAILTLVERSTLALQSLHFDGADTAEQELIRDLWNADPPQLTHLLVESEVVRRKRAILVADARHNERTINGQIGRNVNAASYVAAPIAVGSTVIGVLHADRRSSCHAVGEAEVDALWLFCQALSSCVQLAEATARVRFQRDEVRRHMSALDAALDVRGTPGPQAALAPMSEMELAAAGVVLAPESRIASLLTARELEVLRLMAEGSTNAQIAARLVITEGTVKSHVKNVLRKLRAGNRVEAVSRYLRIAGRDHAPA